MVEDAVGEVIGGAVEFAADALGGTDTPGRDNRRRRGCWRLFLIVLVIAAIVGIIIAVMP